MKKEAKLLNSGAPVAATPTDYNQKFLARPFLAKVFWFFFSKKNRFLPGASRAALPKQEESSFTRVVGIIPTGDEVDRSAARKDFFSEEKKQKTFTRWYARCGNANLLQSKVFWFFFSKKNCFPSAAPAPRQAIGNESASKPVGITGFPYSLFFFLAPDTAIVTACLHGRRHPAAWQSLR